jgi:aryl-alcohol dehydrogenase-like predicted oxidoreductase
MAGVEHFVSSQPMYSMLWRLPEEAVFPLCAQHGIGQIVFSPLAQGVLTGKYRRGETPPADSRAASEAMGSFIGFLMTDDVLDTVERLAPIANDEGITLTQLALAWVLRRDEVAAAIVGASRPEQLDDSVAASGIELSDATVARIDAALAP